MWITCILFSTKGGEALVAALHEGVPEHEVALASTQAMIREIAKTYPQVEVLDSKFKKIYIKLGIEILHRLALAMI